MPKGGPPTKTRAQKLKGDWLSGPGRVKKGRGGKGADPDRVVYDPSYTPGLGTAGESGKTAIGQKKPMKSKVYAAGSNVLTREKRLSYDQALKQGTRADDPRNWEFHYKAPKGGFHETKGASAAENKAQAYSNARMRAKRDAKYAGKELYQVRKMEYDTETVKAETKQASANRKALGRFGSTRAAAGVEAQKQLANRRASRGRSLTTEAFEENKPKKRAGALV